MEKKKKILTYLKSCDIEIRRLGLTLVGSTPYYIIIIPGVVDGINNTRYHIEVLHRSVVLGDFPVFSSKEEAIERYKKYSKFYMSMTIVKYPENIIVYPRKKI